MGIYAIKTPIDAAPADADAVGVVAMSGSTRVAFMATFSEGTPNGSFTIQGSVDGLNYADLPGLTAQTVTTATPAPIDIVDSSFPFLKAKWTNSGSTAGTLITVKAQNH